MYSDHNKKAEIAEKQNFTKTQNESAITKKDTFSMIKNITSIASGSAKKKKQLVALSNEENRVANFLKQKLEKKISISGDRNSPRHPPILEDSLIFQSDDDELSKEEKKIAHVMSKKKILVIRNPCGSIMRKTSDSPRKELRNLNKIKTSQTMGFSCILNEMDEAKEKHNSPSSFSLKKN